MNKKKELTIDSVVKNYLPFFSRIGMTENQIRNSYKAWSESGITFINDYVWHLFQTLLSASANQSKTTVELYNYQKDIYLEMLFFRRKYEKDKANKILQLFLDANIKKTLLETRSELRIIIISEICCDYCDGLSKSSYEPLDVLKNKYLGSEKCTDPNGCNCVYAFESIRDSNGRLKPHGYQF